MNFILIMMTLVLGSFVLTGVFRKYALQQNLLDLPNERSSHTTPTPRGGGVVFVGLFGVFVLAMLLIGTVQLNSDLMVAVLAGLSIAALGFLDDRFQLSAKLRLAAQFGIFILFFMYHDLPGLVKTYDNGAYISLILFVIQIIIQVVFSVWLTNLYNFMDGIDGISSIEGMCFFAGAPLIILGFAALPLTILSWALTALLLGFFAWNFPRAKIFMGDVGSSFLGCMAALMTILYADMGWPNFIACLILLAVFITDATMTLCQRFILGENIFQAHRSHAYQHASRLFGSHISVTLGVGIINVLWLLPVAYVAAHQWLSPLVAMVFAYLPIIALTYYFQAGKKEFKQRGNDSPRY